MTSKTTWHAPVIRVQTDRFTVFEENGIVKVNHNETSKIFVISRSEIDELIGALVEWQDEAGAVDAVWKRLLNDDAVIRSTT